MFCSNMFGMIKQCVIPIDAIVKVVELTQTSLLITAKVNALENEFFFSGFKNSNAFKLINALWKKEKIASEVLVSNQEEDGLEG